MAPPRLEGGSGQDEEIANVQPCALPRHAPKPDARPACVILTIRWRRVGVRPVEATVTRRRPIDGGRRRVHAAKVAVSFWP
jgi:hypothetical protein